MKVMLPVKNDETWKTRIAEGFHNLSCLCIYDCDSASTEWVLTKEFSETPGGLNAVLTEKGIYSIITVNITPMVLAMFSRNEISVYKAQGADVEQNIRLFRLGQLKSFTTEESRLIMSSCNSSSCASCNSSCN